jgi:vesicle coat complex subunit
MVSFDEILKATHSTNPQIRKSALKEFCPCHVKKDIDPIWDRILEMVTDADATVRDQVVHSLCDGSPKSREDQVISALESMWNDRDERVKKRVRRALTAYRRNGSWNIF